MWHCCAWEGKSRSNSSVLLKSNVPTMASSHRENEDNEDDLSDNDARITLSLLCLDTDVSDNNLDNLSDVSPRRPRKSIYSPREPRWPPREPERRFSRETTRRSTRASITRQSPPPRPRSCNTYPPACRSRRNRSPSYMPPSSDQHISMRGWERC